ncbi:hypothetical protein ONZ45_g17520 [Pleurotus djamor]|nr:hypothetical protein ONZ45_g17520 [Pleurotus djamor]
MARPGHSYVDDRVADHDLIPPSPLFSVSEPTDRTPLWLNSYSVPRSPTHPHLPTPPGAENKHFGLLIPICLHCSALDAASLSTKEHISGSQLDTTLFIQSSCGGKTLGASPTASNTLTHPTPPPALEDCASHLFSNPGVPERSRFNANSDHFGFHRSRGLTNDLEYTYSSPSAYTSDRGMSSTRGKSRQGYTNLEVTPTTSNTLTHPHLPTPQIGE